MTERRERGIVAALFVDPAGVYADIPDVELWGEDRDARTYTGPHPVVCHPPCHLWTNLAHVNFKRWGGEHNRPGNDGGRFRAAVEAVSMYGGVLEHPAFSNAWKALGLLKPASGGWTWDGSLWTCEVWQSAYGHKARKRTWLAYKGNVPPPTMNWERKPGTHQCGWFDRKKPSLGKREASATPKAFAEVLIAMARSVK